MSNTAGPSRGLCPAPFWDASSFPDNEGSIDGRLCQSVGSSLTCCLPCPLTDWVYPDTFVTITQVADWVSVVGTACCAFLLISWAFLPVEKTHRHYLSISVTAAIFLMNLAFVIPLAAQPQQCINDITPNSMTTSKVCAASGAFIILGGWGGVIWVFLRSLALHLQICWQMVMGKSFMLVSQATGWGIPIIGTIIVFIFSGVSFRFGSTCVISYQNSLADFWIPLLVFAALTVIIQFATFGYCIKVYLASLSDQSPTTEGSSLPTYSNSTRTMTPHQAYRRVQRVIQLQWRGIAIVLIIIADVVFFSIVFVFLDNNLQEAKTNPAVSLPWVECLLANNGDKTKCFAEASSLVVNQATVGAVVLLLALNGVWLLFLLGRWSMVLGWLDLIRLALHRNKGEFVSLDARHELQKDQRSYEMLSRDSSAVVTPVTPAVKSPASPSTGRVTPNYFGKTARYNPPAQSFSNPRPQAAPSLRDA